MSSQPDVIIIGAGSAGLSAAKELTKQGLSYTVVGRFTPHWRSRL